MASIGEAPYEWSLESDVLAGAPNATEVLLVGGLAAISSGAITLGRLGPMRPPVASTP